jgi:primosomal protein N' (replication factor Y)
MIYYLVQIDENEGFYTYLDIKGEYSISEQVIVNFAGRKKTALIVAKDTRTSFNYEVKPILEKVESGVKVSLELLHLFFWMKDYYLSSFREVINASYPKNLRVKYKKICTLAETFNKISLEDENLIEYLNKKKSISYETLTKNFNKELIDKHIKEKNIILIKEPKFKKQKEKSEIYDLSVEENKVTLNDEHETVSAYENFSFSFKTFSSNSS